MSRPSIPVCGCVIAGALFSRLILAADPRPGDRPGEVASATPNAAVVYWQAFAVMPSLNGEHKQNFEAATEVVNGPLGDDLQPIVALFEASLREMHRAQTIAQCDWQLDYSPNQLLLPHLQKARELSRAALLRARLRFAAGETDSAVGDVVAVLRMARDCGRSPLLLSLAVDFSIESLATDVLVANLSRMNPQQLDQLTESLKQLPASVSLAECIRGERNLNCDWLERRINEESKKHNNPKAGGKLLAAIFDEQVGIYDADDSEAQRRRGMVHTLTVADVRESLRLMRADWDEMSMIASLDYAEQSGRLAELRSALAEASKFAIREDLLRHLSVSCVPMIGSIYRNAERLRVRRGMLLLAVQIQRHGPEVLQAVDAFGIGKVEHQKTATGFELRYQLSPQSEPEVFQVRAPK